MSRLFNELEDWAGVAVAFAIPSFFTAAFLAFAVGLL
ncbi:MAG: hypothetical protein JWM77_107 [Rhodospirillales bacterium]|jgi:hypothetical protein|nr:hypothetical protein [Rhodospirillales bacterium]